MIQRNIHFAGKRPSRTCIVGPVHSKHNGKWSAAFQTWAGEPGSEYMVNSVASGALFDSEDAAYAAADRAMDVLQETGKYPNMCEVF
jgi:hypothetical protein